MLSQHTNELVDVEDSGNLYEISQAFQPRKALITRALDFWLLGGISFAAWMLSLAATYGLNLNDGFDRHVQSWPYAFSALSLICNYPHFMSSYRIAYGNGRKKILAHWGTLILLPLALIALFYAAFAFRTKPIEGHPWISQVYGFSRSSDIGSDFMRVGVWLMWVTVGWHYAKQTFGVMLRYAFFDGYTLSKRQRFILKFTLLSVVPANFVFVMGQMKVLGSNFQDLTMPTVEIPHILGVVSYVISLAAALCFGACVLQIYIKQKKLPSVNFITPFVAFYLWWFPGLWPEPYAMIMVPFFHSLQYLPFAYKRIESDLSEKSKRRFPTIITVNIIAMLVIGLFVFDVIPTWLDIKVQTRFEFGSSFFLISALLFLNIHHFFVDSSIWHSKKVIKVAE